MLELIEKAEEIGCTEAHFVTPNGLDGEDVGGVHSISAADLAKIMSYCVLPKLQNFLRSRKCRHTAFLMLREREILAAATTMHFFR